MNHIAKLQFDLNAVNVERDQLVAGIRELLAYCSSGKFYEEPYVNVQDILLRGREIIHNAESARQVFEDEAMAQLNKPKPIAYIWFDEDDRRYRACDDKTGIELGTSFSRESLRRSIAGKGYEVHLA